MSLYLWHVNYTVDGTKGLLKDGGSKRRATVQKMIEQLGGRLQAFYYAFGDTDAYLIVDLPDHASVAAVSLTVFAAGAAQVKTTVLLTPEEIDSATKKAVAYRAPGS
jgi:uncharacterized protein with GYD domain